jgi:hypothetical protein
VTMLDGQGPVQAERWAPVLLSWGAWTEAEVTQLLVEEPRGG